MNKMEFYLETKSLLCKAGCIPKTEESYLKLMDGFFKLFDELKTTHKGNQ